MQDVSFVLSQLKTKGFYVIENYLSGKECDSIVKKMKEYYEKYDKKINCKFSEEVGGDERLFGIENVDETAKKILNDSFFLEVLKKYMNIDTLHPSVMLLGYLKYEKGFVKNSGGNWHRDSLNKQVKAIIYLTDVNEKNGNFQFIPNSRVKDLGDKRGNRLGNNIEDICKEKNKEIVNVIGKKGTVILVDTSNIHRGNVIEEGERYSLTSYYFNDEATGEKFINRIKNNYISI